MGKYDLSILIPARNEMFLAETVKGILANKRGKTEVLVALDGEWADPPIPDHPDVTTIYFPKSIGQRAATNQLARISKAKYLMKLDAHCALDEGFDIKLMANMQDDWTVIPAMYNLHAFDWVCIGPTDRSGNLYDDPIFEDKKKQGCGHRIYQGPTPEKCPQCSGHMDRELVFKPRLNRRSEFYRFDKNLHFQYWGELKNRPGHGDDLAPSLSAQGSCFMLTRDKYWEFNICDEAHGSWGQQGVEVSLKTWESGGKLMINKKTWYAHMFRTQGGDFGFPYPLSGSEVDKARKYSKDLWLNDNWPKAKLTLRQVLDIFKPVPEWHSTTQKGVIFYTDNQLNLKIAHAVQKQLGKAGLPIVSVSLKPMNFGNNVYLPLKRGHLTMAKQILAALEGSSAEIIFFAEHDVLYHPSHFSFTPPEKDKYYYNTNVWRVKSSDGHALWTDNLQQLSGLCGYRDTLINHFKERVRRIEAEGYSTAMGFEPGTHEREERIDDLKAESYESELPNVDIRHDNNLTPSRWNKEEFRNAKYIKGWRESEFFNIEGWGFNNGLSFMDNLKIL